MSASKFKREYKLVQDTPMWHFQPDEKGCCLRATEVKPKLDRFLADQCRDGIPDKRYKLSFKANGSKKNCEDNVRLFFGNMGESAKQKSLIFYKGGITMTIFSTDVSLLEKIDENIDDFFAVTSFGTRQSKGYGFFSIERNQALFPTQLFDYYFKVSIPAPEKSENSFQKYEGWKKTDEMTEVFRHILYFNKFIRSGLNIPNENTYKSVYYKSLMFSYAKSKGLSWDKPAIRLNFQNTEDNICYKKLDEEHKRDDMELNDLDADSRKEKSRWLFRDALGLSAEQSWWYYDKCTIKISSDTIERFKSPVTYRPKKSDGEWRVYIKLDKIPAAYYDAQFDVSCSKKGSIPMKGMKIYHPRDDKGNYRDFIEDYFDFIFKEAKNCLMEKCGYNKYIDKIFWTDKDGKLINFVKIEKEGNDVAE